MADAGVGSPPAKSKAKAAAVAADPSSPTSDARTATVRVPGGGSLSVSSETPGYATNETGRTVRITSSLAKQIISSPAEGALTVRDDVLGSGKDAKDPVHTEEAALDLDQQPELRQAATAKKERADEKDRAEKKATKAAKKAAAARKKELISVEDIRHGAAAHFRSESSQLVLQAHPIAVTHLEVTKTMMVVLLHPCFHIVVQLM